jgi:hypothetical protein
MEPAHSLKFVVDPSLIDADSLTAAVNGHFKQVVWQPGAADAEILQYAGFHRIETLKLVLSSTLKEYNQLKESLQKNPDNVKKLERHDELVNTLNTNGIWLISFYSSTSGLFNDVRKLNDVQTPSSRTPNAARQSSSSSPATTPSPPSRTLPCIN